METISKELTVSALVAAKKAGDAILSVYETGFEVEYKEDESPLTLADKRSHEIIVKDLLSFDLPILSEEGRDIPYDRRKEWPLFWLLDPLDGTKEFIKRNGEFTVNIAVIRGGKPVLGVIYQPVGKVFYFAAEGVGSYKLVEKEGVDLSIGEKETPEDCLSRIIALSAKLPVQGIKRSAYTIVGSRSHSTPDLDAFVEKMRKEHAAVEFVSSGSSLKLCLVAEGAADVYPRLAPTMEWDTAAGQAIVEFAGGKVVDDGTDLPLRYNKENLLNPWFRVTGKDGKADQG